MKILMTGATGRIGQLLGQKLVREGHELIVLTRDPAKAAALLPFPARSFAWSDQDPVPPKALEGVEAVFHLAGESIAGGRWSPARKKRIRDSRVLGTRRLVSAIAQLEKDGTSKVRQYIAASAVGYYGETGTDAKNEHDNPGAGFLAEVCEDWEREAEPLYRFNIRVVQLRIGIVLEAHGGALQAMRPLFMHGAGAALGSGAQFMSWIHREDLAELFVFALHNPQLHGPVNAVAPAAVTNGDFSASLAGIYGHKLRLRAPSALVKLALGELSEMLLTSTHVSAKKVLDAGFKYKYPTLDLALAETERPTAEGAHELLAEQWVPKKPNELFPFFADEKNLEELTPSFLNFKVVDKSTEAIEEGTLIRYRLALYGLPFGWKTRIEEWTPGERFVDTQLSGPYSEWHHTHEFEDFAGGTLMTDRVRYRLPLGMLGDIVAGWKVEGDVRRIFEHRRQQIARRYGAQR